MAKRYTPQEIEILSKNPCVKHVRENRLTLTYEFKLILWNEWYNDPSVNTIRKVLRDYHFDCTLFNNKFFHNIEMNFKRNGKPKNGSDKLFGISHNSFRMSTRDNEYLLSTGKFIKAKKGIRFHPDFINEIFHTYPEISIEDHLIKNNIDPKMVGYQRIYLLKQKFGGTNKENIKISDEIVDKYKSHPYISRITNKQCVLTESFYHNAYYLKDMHIDKLLSVFNIDGHNLSETTKNRIMYKLRHWERKSTDSAVNDIDILTNINKELTDMVNHYFKAISKVVPSLLKAERKRLCQWINDLPVGRSKMFSKDSILKKIGISRSNYYYILSNDQYGSYEASKNDQDDKDIKTVKEVIDYRGYPKGIKQIYMMMNEITGRQFGLNKIMRLMRKYDMPCKVRKSNKSRQQAKALLKRNVKPNLLKRKFRLARPLKHLLTDVSYLKYGLNHTAYLSTVKDAVSGKILSCAVSENNDLTLACDTLESLNHYSFNDGQIFHSDQGTLYLTDTFQKRICEMGLRQSMSKRGNCWDNASQESFFGHFKDECIYNDCESAEDLRELIEDYMDYYNNDRPQWTRNRMTPSQYENHLLNMSDIEFDEYYCREEMKYQLMMKKAADKAIKRAKDIGA